MADNLNITEGSGKVVAADDVSSVYYQRVKLVDGTDDSTAYIPGDSTYGLDVDVTRLPTLANVTTVATVTTVTNPVTVVGSSVQVELVVASAAAAYASGDIVGAELTIAGAARANGGTGKITGVTLSDYAKQDVQGELWITDTAVTEPADNAAWSITDAESATVVTVIPFALYYDSALNGVAPMGNLSIPFKCTASTTSLYCCYVTRGAPTYIANGLHLKIFIDQN